MTVLLHISDLHFGTEVPDAMAALVRLHAEVAPDLLVISGDITQRASRRQFDKARAFLTALAPPALLMLPGNHDVPLFNLALRLTDPYRRWREAFGPELEPVHDGPGLLAIGVNTVQPRWHKDGAVSPAQIARVAERLARAQPGQLRVVVTHQPAAVIRPEDEEDRLVGADEALRAWLLAGVDLVLGGHIHLPYVVSLARRYPELQRQGWLVQAGTAISHRTRPGVPNSVNLIRSDTRAADSADSAYGGTTLTIDRLDYYPAAQIFRQSEHHLLAPEP